MAACYLHLLLGDVASHLYQFHAVEQWAWDGIDVVGCGNEHHPAQVVVHVEEVVVEGAVLLRVEHLEQSR